MAKPRDPLPVTLQMIQDGIEDPDAEDDRENAFDGYNFDRARRLSLSFKNIAKIENLTVLRNLVQLRLDNNLITKIEGIEHLTNLAWLDLSFNKIKELVDLSKLTKLTDLSLFGNSIEHIEPLSTAVSLECLSLGNNAINDIKEIRHLVQLPKLQVLTLEGNPITKSRRDIYKNSVLNVLPNLKYLDYALVLPSDVKMAHDSVGGVPTSEPATSPSKASAAVRRDSAVGSFRSSLRGASLPAGDSIADLMYDDGEITRLAFIPGFTMTLSEIRLHVVELEHSFQEMTIEHNAKVEEEIAAFEYAYTSVTGPIEEFLQGQSGHWEAAYARFARPYMGESDQMLDEAAQAELETLRKNAAEVVKTCTEAETVKHKEINRMLDAFDNAIKALKTQKLASAEVYFRKLEDIHNSAWPQQIEHADEFILSLKGGQPPRDDIPSALLDRDTLLAAMVSAKESVVTRLTKKELEIRNADNARFTSIVSAKVDQEIDRNRANVAALQDWKVGVERKLISLLDPGLENVTGI